MSSKNCFSENKAFQQSTRKPILTFLRCKMMKYFWKVVLLQRLILKNQFNLKTWCVVEMLFQNLTRCKNLNSETDKLKKNSWKFHSQLKFLFKAVFYCSFLYQIHTCEKNTKLPNLKFWSFYVAKGCKKQYFDLKSFFLQKLMHFKTPYSKTDAMWQFNSKFGAMWKFWKKIDTLSKNWFRLWLIFENN